MRKLTVLSVLTCWCLLAASAANAAEPPASSAEATTKGCSYLWLYLTSKTDPIHVLKVVCDHGSNEGTTPSEGLALTTTLKQSSAYGPDCTITVSNGAVLKIQQNYCATSPGKITAKVSAGDATITKTQNGKVGSRPGQVWVSIP